MNLFQTGDRNLFLGLKQEKPSRKWFQITGQEPPRDLLCSEHTTMLSLQLSYRPSSARAHEQPAQLVQSQGHKLGVCNLNKVSFWKRIPSKMFWLQRLFAKLRPQNTVSFWIRVSSKSYHDILVVDALNFKYQIGQRNLADFHQTCTSIQASKGRIPWPQ